MHIDDPKSVPGSNALLNVEMGQDAAACEYADRVRLRPPSPIRVVIGIQQSCLLAVAQLALLSWSVNSHGANAMTRFGEVLSCSGLLEQ